MPTSFSGGLSSSVMVALAYLRGSRRRASSSLPSTSIFRMMVLPALKKASLWAAAVWAWAGPGARQADAQSKKSRGREALPFLGAAPKDRGRHLDYDSKTTGKGHPVNA